MVAAHEGAFFDIKKELTAMEEVRHVNVWCSHSAGTKFADVDYNAVLGTDINGYRTLSGSGYVLTYVPINGSGSVRKILLKHTKTGTYIQGGAFTSSTIDESGVMFERDDNATIVCTVVITN